MDGRTTIKYLQNFIRQKDCRPELLKDYFLKLAEEVGELSWAMRNGLKAASPEEIKGTVDEELWDVIYYAIAIANLYDIDLEQVIKTTSRMNESRYPSLWCLRKTGEKVKSKCRKNQKNFLKVGQAASARYFSNSAPDVSKPKISRG